MHEHFSIDEVRTAIGMYRNQEVVYDRETNNRLQEERAQAISYLQSMLRLPVRTVLSLRSAVRQESAEDADALHLLLLTESMAKAATEGTINEYVYPQVI